MGPALSSESAFQDAATGADLELMRSDFGRIAFGNPLAVLRPASVAALIELVLSARKRGAHLTLRGSGSSQSGQSVAAESFAVDLSPWKRIDPVDTDQCVVRCEPGVTWRELLQHTLPLGLAPKVQPLNLDLTLGGTLSAGGLGSTSHRHGFAVAHVASADVVLGTGELVTTSPTRERDVYDAVFGGLGRAGVIASVALQLEAAPRKVQTFVLRYSNLEKLLSDQQHLTRQASTYHSSAVCAASVHGLARGPGGRRQPVRHWSFGLELTARYDEKRADELTHGLQCEEVMHWEEEELGSFLARYDGRFEMMRATGAWQQAHPWLEAVVPLASLPEVAGKLMSLPALFGEGHRLSLINDTERPAALAYPGAGPAALVAVLPVGIAEAHLQPALQVLAQLDAAIYAIGGRRYLSGWLFETGPARWREHYGVQYERLRQLNRRFDPDRVFTSKLSYLER